MTVKRTSLRSVLAAALIAGTLAVAGTAPAVADAAETARGLAGHRAVYDLSLGRRADRADVTEVGGRLVYEFSGAPCEGWSSRFRLVTRLTNADGKGRVSDMRTSSFEDADGRSYEFVNQTLVDGRSIEDTKGTARRDGATTRVALAGRDGKPVEIAATALFPTAHLVAIIEAAKAGRTVAEIDLYDGSEGGSRLFRTTAVIGREQTGPDDTAEEPAAAAAVTSGKRRWPVDISYFDPAKSGGDATPEYQLAFLLYENGVSRRLRLDYGDFAIAGRMSSLETLPATACK